MRVLIINKFLHPNGGSETYIFKIGKYLESHGQEVEFFGMENEGRCVGNHINAYTSKVDFHGEFKLAKLTYAIKTIYSREARVQIRKVLEHFEPDICHINNFNFQLTPSIILEIDKWRKQTSKDCRIVYTAHDSQLVCPNHLMQNPTTGEPCTKCLGGHYINCIKGKCIHGSTAKSMVGAIEAIYWNARKTYKLIDVVISPSEFLGKKLATNPILNQRLCILHNFIDKKNEINKYINKEYILFFGRYSKEKGILTLLKVVKELPYIPFVFAGNGPFEGEVNKLPNIENRGFLSGEALKRTISEAKFTVFTSECFENCPFSVMESQMYGTPVLGANIGGIPELIEIGRTGELFESGNAEELKEKIKKLWFDKELTKRYSHNCKYITFDDIEEFGQKLMKIYKY